MAKKESIMLRLPQDVQSQIHAYYQPQYNKKGELESCKIIKEIKSPALFFNKFMPTPEQKQLKSSFLMEFARQMQTKELEDLVEHVRMRLEAQLCVLQKSFESPPLVVDCIDCQVVWRMIVGLGAANVLETDMTLHRLYGFPYIPGSAVKGLVRTFAFWQIATKLDITDKDKLEKLANEIDSGNKTQLCQEIRQLQQIFGSTDQQGLVIFFDALPLRLPELELDIMNPHYSKYYEGSEPPADWLEPVPIPFLTVRQGATFRFYWASQDPTLLPMVRSWLQRAVNELGVGAKTRAGYGELKEASTAQAPAAEGGTTSELATSPYAQLEASIACWKSSEMGLLPNLVESIAKISDVELRRQLAQQLQQKLKEAGKWTRKYQDASWYRALEGLLEVSANAARTKHSNQKS